MPSTPKRILVVEDDSTIREVLCMILSLDGHHVQQAGSGEEALGKCDAQIDLVLTDYTMPGMKGDELAKAIKQRFPNMPIIMLTGFPPDRMPEEVNKVVLKPFNTEFLRRVMVES